MIPQILHYCWFGGGEKPEIVRMCMQSWEKYCPGWKIICWDEMNAPVSVPFVRDALKHKKYAFAADYTRFYALYHQGGVYLDTDMLLVKSIEPFLANKGFLGREDETNAAMGIIGCHSGDCLIGEIMNLYDNMKFDMTAPPIITRAVSPLLVKHGMTEQNCTETLSNGWVVYNSHFFYPIHYSTPFTLDQIESYSQPDTHCIHLWNKSWKDEIALLAEGKYREGFRLAWRRILRTPFLPSRYYKKILKYMLMAMHLYSR